MTGRVVLAFVLVGGIAYAAARAGARPQPAPAAPAETEPSPTPAEIDDLLAKHRLRVSLERLDAEIARRQQQAAKDHAAFQRGAQAALERSRRPVHTSCRWVGNSFSCYSD